MQIVKFLLVFLLIIVNGSMVAVAQNKVAVIPLDDGIIVPVVISDPTTIEGVIGKPLVFNKGWDTVIGNETKIDPTVILNLTGFADGAIFYPGQEIRHWGEQTFFNTALKIYAKAVLMVDRGSFAEGGVFEWSLNNQGRVSLHNIVRTDHQEVGWIRNWTDPRPGDKVWYFLMSDDERFSSNPIEFTWP